MIVADSAMRLVAAAAVVAAYLVLCASVFYLEQRRRRIARGETAALTGAPLPLRGFPPSGSEPSFGRPCGGLMPAAQDVAPVLVAFASQTGTARSLAWQTARSLHVAGVPSRVLALSEMVADDLQQARRVLFLVSTYGEGDPPDNAAGFVRRLMNAPRPDAQAPTGQAPLCHLHYGLLAIGDRAYANFRGFGLALEHWLARQGAQPLFDRVDVDAGDEAALHDWQHRLGRIAGTSDLPDWQAPSFHDWRVLSRLHLNPGSAGNPIFHVELAWPEGSTPQWQAGDLLQVVPPGEPVRPREYSIASLPADGCVHLLVRQERRSDGSVGEASRLLAESAQPGTVIRARLRTHESFRLGQNAGRPLILIGNGSGLAGLLGILRARAASGCHRNWLLYGERNAIHDFHHRGLIEHWMRTSVLERVDMAFSRDSSTRRYVQHALRDAADLVRQWVAADAAIYVCGSLRGMAGGVDDALAEILTREALDGLAGQGRYRRDVY